MKIFNLRNVVYFLTLTFLVAGVIFSTKTSQARSGGPVPMPTVYGITITKVALLNDQPVDEVCGGQTVTFRYTVTNLHPEDQFFHVNVQDSDPTLGDIDGSAAGVGMAAGQSQITFMAQKFIAAGQVSNSSGTVTANYSDRPYTPTDRDAFTDTDTATVTGVFCDVSVNKRVDGTAPTGNQEFTFELRTGASTMNNGTTIATAVANAGNGGNFSIGSGLQGGTPYQFCETNVLPGWTTSLSSLPGAFVPSSANPPADNGVVCVGFMLNPSEGTVFEVNNHRELVYGPARTIGYWKNWSSCSSGKQAPILDYILSTFGQFPAIPPSPLPKPLPAITTGAYLGGAQINSCAKGGSILDKSTFAGVKKASDPAYNMAAQLLAVKLNIQAGADPRCIGPYVTEADGILTAISFNGSTVPTITAAQGARLNVLATYFDRYNNGDPNLCPLP
jgi:hypothetical protein